MNSTQIEKCGLVAIIRSTTSEGVQDTARALVRGGVRALEVTLNTPGALEHIAALRAAFEAEYGDNIFVGAGTILKAGDAERALDAGAQFIVTPTLQPETIALCRQREAPILCGCFTPTEALAAHEAGADFIKIFPATSLGASYMRDVLAPLPFLRLVPTGGVKEGNITEFLEAGCKAVAVGGSLVNSELVAAKDWDALEERARRFVAVIHEFRREED